MISIESLEEQSKVFLNPRAIEAMRIHKNQLQYTDGNREGCKVIHLGVVVNEHEVMTGLQAICRDLNQLADNGFIVSHLCKPSACKLATDIFKQERVSIFSFVHVADHNLSTAKTLISYETPDAEVGKELGDTRLKLQPDYLLTVIRVTYGIHGQPNHDSYVRDEVNRYLMAMPQDTEVVSVTQCAITDLSIPYRVIFKSPSLSGYKYVHLEKTTNVGIDRLEGPVYYEKDYNESN